MWDHSDEETNDIETAIHKNSTLLKIKCDFNAKLGKNYEMQVWGVQARSDNRKQA